MATCKGITVAGTPCKKYSKKGSEQIYYHLHLDQQGVGPSLLQSFPSSSSQSLYQGITMAETQCKKFPKKRSGQMYCHLHLDQQGARPPLLQPPSSSQSPYHGITMTETRCKNLLRKGSPEQYCHLHCDQRSFRPPSLQLLLPSSFNLTKHFLFTIQGLDLAIKKFDSSQLQTISHEYLKGIKITKIADMLYSDPSDA